MAAAATVPATQPDPQVVGNAFVMQYYHILHQSPHLVHRFYQNISRLGRPEEDGSMSLTTTMEDINSKILSLNYDELRAEIKSVDAQNSWNDGVNVLVIGQLTGKDNVVRQFTQSFFLAPQDKGFFVLNDMFRYVENASHDEGSIALAEVVEAPVIPEQVAESVPVLENDTSVEVALTTEEPQVEVVSNLPEKVEEAVEEEEEPVAEVVDEVPEVSQLVVESNTKIEEVPKKSFASIVQALKQNAAPFSSPAKKIQPRKQVQQVNNVPPTASVIEAAASNVAAVENGIHEEEADGYSVYIKGLPMSATPAMLDDEFKQFGTIKPNGIQVRSNKGFCFGFVEFEAPEAVQKAIEASPVSIGGRSVVVEEKRSTNSKGGGRGRYQAGRGSGFRNEGVRGRGNFGNGGRGFNRGGDFGDRRNDFGGSRNEYGNRGGGRGGAPSNRGGGGDGFQRERVNRGVAVNGTAKNMAPRVSATA